jgi:predicted nucleic acid-binding protein
LLDTNIIILREWIDPAQLPDEMAISRRAAGRQIAAVALVESLPLFTTKPSDFVGLEKLTTVVPVDGPAMPQEPV